MDSVNQHDADDEYEYEEKAEQKKPRKSAAGRRLMRWNPDVDQLLLLAADAVCIKQGTPIPWDAVAPEIESYLTGEAIKQHLAKVYKFREDAGRKNPEKPEKGARRKSSKLAALATAANTTPSTPARNGRKKRSMSAEEEDDNEAENTSGGSGKSLLWHAPPGKKTTKAVKKESAHGATNGSADVATPETGRSGGSKKAKTGNANGADGALAHLTKSTGKRSRKTNNAAGGDEDEEEKWAAANGSPTKKQKTLRRAKAVNYNEHLSDEDVFDAVQEGDDDDVYEDIQEPPKKGAVKQERTSSQGSTDMSLIPSTVQPFKTRPYPATFTNPDGTTGRVNMPVWDDGTPGKPAAVEQPSLMQAMVQASHGPYYAPVMGAFGGLPYTSGPFQDAGSVAGVGGPDHETDTRDATPRVCGSVEEPILVEDTPAKQKGKAPRKMSPKKKTNQTDLCGGNQTIGSVETGFIPIANDTGYNAHATTANPFQYAFNGNSLAINTASYEPHTPHGQMMTSPIDYTQAFFTNPLNVDNFIPGTTNITPQFNRFGFDDVDYQDPGPQFSQIPVHNDSFPSVSGSETMEAPAMMQLGGDLNFFNEPFNSVDYEREMPSDFLADLGQMEGGIIEEEEEELFNWR